MENIITRDEYLKMLDNKTLFEGGMNNPLERQRVELRSLIENAISNDARLDQLSKYFNFNLGLNVKQEKGALPGIAELYWILEFQYKKDIAIFKKISSEEKYMSKQIHKRYFDFDYKSKVPFIYEIEDNNISSSMKFYEDLLYVFYNLINAGIEEINRDIDKFNKEIQDEKNINFKIQYDIATRLSDLSKEMKTILNLIKKFDEQTRSDNLNFRKYDGIFHNLILDFNIVDIGLKKASLAMG